MLSFLVNIYYGGAKKELALLEEHDTSINTVFGQEAFKNNLLKCWIPLILIQCAICVSPKGIGFNSGCKHSLLSLV